MLFRSQAIINAMEAAGQQRQALSQAQLSQQYQDFLTQKQYPYQQIAFLKEMIAGVPSGSTQQIYQAPASTAATLAGLGTALYGANKLFATGGLAELAADHLAKG